jgi:M6 family metalloprotease-like protein
MRKVLLVLLAFLISFHVGAVPAKRQKTTLTLADGSKVAATFYGDENLHFYLAEDGRAFCLNEMQEVQEVSQSRLYGIWKERLGVRNQQRGRCNAKSFKMGNDSPFMGSRRGLVILVNFQDREMLYELEEYNNFFNREGYKGFGMSGSVHDYFHDQSYGAFDLSFDVVGPVTVSKEMSYYGSNIDEVGGRDQHPAEMIAEAVTLADSLVNYADYDWDKDGYVDQVVVLYAGYSEAQTPGEPSLLWPHEWTLSSAYGYGDGEGMLRKDGVWIDTYACSSELRDSVGTNLDGIGTACHEFSHCLGLPDLYDTDLADGRNFGMSLWSVMDQGAYGGEDYNGATPTGYTSYERMFCGWLRPEKLIDPCVVVDMPALSDSSKAYILYNDSYWDEYYLLENRQNTLWDTYLPGHGMLVLHIDYNAEAWDDNRVNAVNGHPRLTIIPADNHLMSGSSPTLADMAGDPYPGTTGNTMLTDTSLPAATLYHSSMGRNLMGHPITDITEQDSLIGFTYDGGSLVGTPTALEPDSLTEAGFTARWTAVEYADYYQVMLQGQIYDTEDVSYVFADLEYGGSYSYKVRAVLGDYFGEWSNTVSVDLSDITCIKDVNADINPELYDLQGRRVFRPTNGIYILNGTKMKVSF